MTTTSSSAFPARPARRMTLLMTVHDHRGRRGLATEILRRARRAGLAGVTVFEATEGFGGTGHVHRGHLASDDAPLAVVAVDDPAAVDAFLESVAGLLDGVRVVLSDVEVVDL